MKRGILHAILTIALLMPGMLHAQHQAQAGVSKGDVKKASEVIGIVMPLQRMEERGARAWKVQFTEENPGNSLQLSILAVLLDAPATFQAGNARVRAWVIDEVVLAGERYTLLTCNEERAMEFFAMGMGRTSR